jgi:hypothetical protein
MRLKIYHWMILCAALALALWSLRVAKVYNEWTYSYGLGTSVLSAGDQVVVTNAAQGHDQIAGSMCLVVDDSTDIDSAYPRRAVSVKMLDGPWANRFVTVQRCEVRLK